MRFTLALALLPLLAASHALGSAAHPDDHTYVGAGIVGAAGTAALPTCADVSPVDGDPESGVGGACFPYRTAWGDDTGGSLWVQVAEDAPTGPVAFLVCADVDGSGACEASNVLDRCATNSLGVGGVSLLNGGPCSAYEDPAATLREFLYVIPLPAAPGSGYAQPVSGRAWLT